ncbi:MAG: hypothetical protein ACRDJ9_10090, partial [Dehalococcoidia bacterium]
VILHVTLKAGALIADFDRLSEFAHRSREAAIQELRATQATALQATAQRSDPAETRNLRGRYDLLVEAEHAKYDDIGRYAAYHGFDLVHVTEQEYYVILNRTAVRVQREDLR